MEHTISISQPYFKYMKKGYKTIEGRLNKGKFADFKKGDMLNIINNDNKFKVKIKDINKYKSFKEYLTFEGLKKTLPNVNTLEEGVNVYYKFYTKEDEEKYGILAITIKKIK